MSLRLLALLAALLPRDVRRDHGAELWATLEAQWLAEQPMRWIDRWRFVARQGAALIRAAVALRRRRGVLGGADRRPRRRDDTLEAIVRDLRHSARALAARPGLTVATVLTLGLGVGATTAMFSAVHGVLLRDLPYRQADEVVVVRHVDQRDGSLFDGVSAANLFDLGASSSSLTVAGIAHAHGFTLVDGGLDEAGAVSLRSWLVSDGFLDAIGADVQLGRPFRSEEYTAGHETVVLLGHATWRTRFGGDPDILGRELTLDGVPHTVVGVLAEGFEYPTAAEIWAPRPPQPWDARARGTSGMHGVARLAPGRRVGTLQTELDRIADNLAVAHPATNAHLGLRAIPLRRDLVGEVRSSLWLLFGAVGLVLAIAVANVTGLQVARGVGRTREIALRCALGAGTRRILRLAAAESLLLAGAGGLLGFGIARLAVEAIRWFGPDHIPRLDRLAVDTPVLAFGVLVAGLATLAASLVPALQSSRTDPRLALGSGSRGSTAGPRAGRLRDRLVVAEIAVALTLAIGAGLLVRSLDRLLAVDLGFEPTRRLAVQVFAHDAEHRPDLAFFDRTAEVLAALPGVEAVGRTTRLPAADRSFWVRQTPVAFDLDRSVPDHGAEPTAWISAIDPGYADALGIAVRAGRDVSTRDHADTQPVVWVNETFVRRHLRGEEPIGRQLTLRSSGGETRRIVGVLADVRPQGFESDPRPEIYLPLAQSPSGAQTFVVHAAGSPSALLTAVREAIWSVKPSQAIWAAGSMPDLLDDHVRERRFFTALLLAFATLALGLAAVGIYGLMAYAVEQRRSELGIRRALGGRTHDILALVLRRGLALAIYGTALGVVGAGLSSPLLRGLLVGVEPLDPATFVGLSIAIIGLALIAALLPAVRATRIDPMTVLRSD